MGEEDLKESFRLRQGAQSNRSATILAQASRVSATANASGAREIQLEVDTPLAERVPDNTLSGRAMSRAGLLPFGPSTGALGCQGWPSYHQTKPTRPHRKVSPSL